MAYKEDLNETQGEEVKVSCSSCTGKTIHKVLLSVDQSGRAEDGEFDFDWDDHFQIIQCLGCKTVSFRNAHSNSEDFEQIGPDEYGIAVYEHLFPSRFEGRKGLGDDLHHLPTKVRWIYSETLKALNGSSPILT